MSLLGALNSGRSALAANQAALATVANNIANAGNPNYTRQTIDFRSASPNQIRYGLFVGNGVEIASIRRSIDESLEQRLRSASSGSNGANELYSWMNRLEGVFNELSDTDLSSAMSRFFNSWSELSSKPQDIGQRQVVIQEGKSLAQRFRSLRSEVDSLRADTAERLKVMTSDADRLAKQIADLNRQIALSEGGAGGNNALRDNRDSAIRELSQLMDVNVRPDSNGMVNVFVGSEPLVLGAQSRGASLEIKTVGGDVVRRAVFSDNGGPIPLTTGTIGGVGAAYNQISSTLGDLDTLAGNLIFELNRIYTSGQGLEGFDSVSSTNIVSDSTVALNDPASGLKFSPTNGSFVIHVRDKATGTLSSELIRIDLDGLNGDDTSLDDLAAAIDAVENISARVSGGKLVIEADGDAVEITFSQDSSGVLASLGVGTFFTGTDARDIAVSSQVEGNPNLLSVASNNQPADNTTALAIANLANQSLKSLGGRSLSQSYDTTVLKVGSVAATARTDAEASGAILDTLAAQRESVSGVSLDEEAIKLIQYQRAYQGAARIISATDEMMQTLLNMI